jgi:hypothetical protein
VGFDLWLRVLEKRENKFFVFDDVLSRYHVTSGSIMSHTERRLSCCLDIAGRFAPRLKAHSENALKDLWFRIIAIYFEAARTYLARKNYPLLVFLFLQFPKNSVLLLLRPFMFGLEVFCWPIYINIARWRIVFLGS